MLILAIVLKQGFFLFWHNFFFHRLRSFSKKCSCLAPFLVMPVRILVLMEAAVVLVLVSASASELEQILLYAFSFIIRPSFCSYHLWVHPTNTWLVCISYLIKMIYSHHLIRHPSSQFHHTSCTILSNHRCS